MSQSAVVTCQPTGPIQKDARFMATITVTDSGAGTVTLATAQPQLTLTTSGPQNPSVDMSSIDVFKGNTLQVAGVAKYNFDAVCHSTSGASTFTVSAILYDNLGNSIPVTPATITVLPVS